MIYEGCWQVNLNEWKHLTDITMCLNPCNCVVYHKMFPRASVNLMILCWNSVYDFCRYTNSYGGKWHKCHTNCCCYKPKFTWFASLWGGCDNHPMFHSIWWSQNNQPSRTSLSCTSCVLIVLHIYWDIFGEKRWSDWWVSMLMLFVCFINFSLGKGGTITGFW